MEMVEIRPCLRMRGMVNVLRHFPDVRVGSAHQPKQDHHEQSNEPQDDRSHTRGCGRDEDHPSRENQQSPVPFRKWGKNRVIQLPSKLGTIATETTVEGRLFRRTTAVAGTL